MYKIAVQLWSLQEKTALDFENTLKTVGKMGYDGVEFAGFGDIDATKMKKLLDENGLKSAGAHIGLDELENNFDNIVEYCKIIDNKRIVCPISFFESYDDCVKNHNRLCAISDKLKKENIIMSYHNHGNEFRVYNGMYANDIIVGDDNKIDYEVDVYWTTYSNVDTINYLKKVGRRCSLIHLKDMQICADGNKKDITFGDGILEHKKILSTADEFCKPDWLIIEWEGFGDMDAFDAVKRGLDNLKELLNL